MQGNVRRPMARWKCAMSVGRHAHDTRPWFAAACSISPKCARHRLTMLPDLNLPQLIPISSVHISETTLYHYHAHRHTPLTAMLYLFIYVVVLAGAIFTQPARGQPVYTLCYAQKYCYDVTWLMGQTFVSSSLSNMRPRMLDGSFVQHQMWTQNPPFQPRHSFPGNCSRLRCCVLGCES